jgi:hypothetical protein
MDIQNICLPAIIYLILGLLSIIRSKGSIANKIIYVIVVFLIAYLFNYVCQTYGENISWYILLFLYLMPFILFILFMLFLKIFR